MEATFAHDTSERVQLEVDLLLAEIETTQTVSMPVRASGRAGGRLLLVDENAARRAHYRAWVQTLSQEFALACLEAGGGAEAIAHLHAVDLILCDVGLARRNRWDVCRILRSGALPDRAPLLLIGEDDNGEARAYCRAGGADALLAEPFDANALRAFVRPFLSGT